jgi:hypothetical protein
MINVRVSHTLLIKPRTLLGQFDAPGIYLLRSGSDRALRWLALALALPAG